MRTTALLVCAGVNAQGFLDLAHRQQVLQMDGPAPIGANLFSISLEKSLDWAVRLRGGSASEREISCQRWNISASESATATRPRPPPSPTSTQ